MSTFNFKDAVLTITPAIQVDLSVAASVVPAGDPFRIFSATKVTGDPGGKATYMKGFDVTPLAVLIQTAEGKLTIECSNASEVWSARQSMGGVYSTMIITLSFIREGMIPQTFAFAPATWTNGGLFDGSDGNGWTDKIEVMFTGCTQNQISIYNANA